MKRVGWLVVAAAVAVVSTLFALNFPGEDRTLTFDGLAPVRIGMSLPEAEAALGTKLKSVYPDMPGNCWFGNRADGVDGAISYWIENGTVVRVDIDDNAWPNADKVAPRIATERGIRIGSPSNDVKKAYGPGLSVEFHPQGNDGDQNYLFMTAFDNDKQRGLLFEVWEGKVSEIQAGTAETYYIHEPCT